MAHGEWYDEYRLQLSQQEALHNAQLVANHFAGTDWTPQSISALCGNMRHESYLNPDMYELGYDWSEDRGYGLVQWTPRSKYWNWANERGLDERSGYSQLQRIDYEVDNGIQWIANGHQVRYGNGNKYDFSYSQFRANSVNESLDNLVEAFMWNYEGPNYEAGQNSLSDRQSFAQLCYNELDFEGFGKPVFPTTEGLDITSPYGWRDDPDGNEGQEFHSAIDIGGGGQNHPIYATQSGDVIYNADMSGGGWSVRIKHDGDPYYSQYLHLASQSPVSVGTKVDKGQEIGTMGTTGNSTGIHLDFSIATSADGFFTQDGTIDPEEYLNMNFGGGGDPNPPEQNVTDLLTLYLSGVLKWGFDT